MLEIRANGTLTSKGKTLQGYAAVFAVGVYVLGDGQAPVASGLLAILLFVADESADGFLKAVGFEAELLVIIDVVVGHDLLHLTQGAGAFHPDVHDVEGAVGGEAYGYDGGVVAVAGGVFA